MGSEALKAEQKRSSDRLDLVKLATIHVDGEKHPAKIINVSAGGIGVWGVEIQSGSKVEVEWKKGEKLAASVVWAIGEAAGLVFDEVLSEGHDLLNLPAKK